MSALALPLAGVRVVEFVPTGLPDGKETLAPLLTLAWEGERLPKRLDPPKIGEHTVEFLRRAGLPQPEVEELVSRGVAALSPAPDFPRR